MFFGKFSQSELKMKLIQLETLVNKLIYKSNCDRLMHLKNRKISVSKRPKQTLEVTFELMTVMQSEKCKIARIITG